MPSQPKQIATMEQDLKLLVRQFKALSNEHRLRLLLQIIEHEHTHGREQGCSISELVSDWRICAPTVSHHIHIMESAGLIDVEKAGKFIIARVNLESYELSLRVFHTRPEAEHMAQLLRSRTTETIENN